MFRVKVEVCWLLRHDPWRALLTYACRGRGGVPPSRGAGCSYRVNTRGAVRSIALRLEVALAKFIDSVTFGATDDQLAIQAASLVHFCIRIRNFGCDAPNFREP